jgi:hypothetical protein
MKNQRPNTRFKPFAFLVIILLLPGFSQEANAAWPWPWNRYDKAQLKHGKWRVYHDDSAAQVLHYRGRYRHGKEAGIWKTYTSDGKLYFKERIRPRKQDIKTVYYHPNGKVSHRGLGYLRNSEKGGLNFYWDGTWEFFDEAGKPLGTKTYVKGDPVSEALEPIKARKNN